MLFRLFISSEKTPAFKLGMKTKSREEKNIIGFILLMFIFWRLSLFLLTYLGSSVFPLISNNGPGSVSPFKSFNYLNSWAQWDGGYYLSIAQNGYRNLQDFAFFPLYPFLVSIFGRAFNNFLFAGLLVSNILFFLFLLVFYAYIKRFFSTEIARISTITFLFFPTSFFATAMYSESLFLLLSMLTFYLLYRKKYFFSAIAASFSALTRAVGLFLGLSLVYSYFVGKHKKDIPGILMLIIPFLAFLAYMIYLKVRVGDAFIFLNVQDLWQRSFTDPVSTLIASAYTLLTVPKPLITYLDFALTVLFISLLIVGRRKIPSSLWIFSTLVILFPVSTGTLSSMPRYLLSSIGTFIIGASYLKSRPKTMYGVWAISLILQIFLAVRFINGYWAS